MNTKISNKAAGFTIIEVLIVLAIAGLILLVVFLAVPALQRNSRNTQIRNDAAAALGYINEFSSNSNGALPASICTPGTNDGIVRFRNTTGACTAADPEAGRVRGGVTVTSGTAMPTTAQSLVVLLNSKCNATGTGFPSPAATTNRAIAIGFLVETAAGGTTGQCVES